MYLSFTVSHANLCKHRPGEFVPSRMGFCAEQAQTSERRCSELEEQLQAMKTKMVALQKQAAENLSLQTATPRKVRSCLQPR